MKNNFIIALFVFLATQQSFANLNNAFLKNIEDVIQIKYSDGSVYHGQVKECVLNFSVVPCMHGKGVYTFRAGSKYVGDFLNNKPDGQGLFKHADGQSYEGEFKDGLINGQGVMIYPNGIRYEGNFKNNGNFFCNTSLYNVGNGWESIFFLRRLFRKVNIIVNSSLVQFLQSMPSFVCFLKPLWRVVNQIQDHRDCSWTLFAFCFIQDPIQ